MEPRNAADRSRVFILGFERFSVYYLPHADEVVSRLELQGEREEACCRQDESTKDER